MEPFERELIVAECFGIEEKYLEGELSELDQWRIAEIAVWSVSQYEGDPDSVTREETIRAIDQRIPQVGLRPHDSNLKRFRKFHGLVVPEAGIIPEAVGKRGRSGVKLMEKTRERGKRVNLFLS